MEKSLLSLAESKALRGIAILGIMLHNYCHFLGFAVKENEYTFTQAKPEMLLDRLMHADGNLFVHVLSFFGHYGVPVFLFISGFGLVMKYERKTEERVRALPFTAYHYLKLLRLMLLGYVAFAVVSYLHPHGYHGYTFGRVIAQLLMYINILPDPDHIIKPGPYWFFGLMLQLYVVYRLLIYRRRPVNVVILIAACWLAQAVFTPTADPGGEILNRRHAALRRRSALRPLRPQPATVGLRVDGGRVGGRGLRRQLQLPGVAVGAAIHRYGSRSHGQAHSREGPCAVRMVRSDIVSPLRRPPNNARNHHPDVLPGACLHGTHRLRHRLDTARVAL